MDDLALALALADAADEVTMPLFRSRDFAVENKPDLTPVTEADRGTERTLRAMVERERPGDAVLGEEYGSTGDSAREWILDPIDGTKNFVRGAPVWATLIALRENGVVTTGVVSAPALGRRWWATRGGGAFADGSPISVSRVGDVGDAFFAYSSLNGWEELGRLDGFLDLSRRVWRTRAFGDFWNYLLVAEGVCDVAAEPEVSLWDLAPLSLIVEEAGGRFTSLDGVPGPDGGNAVGSNGLLHDEVLRILAPNDE